MSRKIKAGDTVEIVAVVKTSAWYKRRRNFIGLKVELKEINVAGGRENPWKSIGFHNDKISSSYVFIHGVKVRRVKP